MSDDSSARVFFVDGETRIHATSAVSVSMPDIVKLVSRRWFPDTSGVECHIDFRWHSTDRQCCPPLEIDFLRGKILAPSTIAVLIENPFPDRYDIQIGGIAQRLNIPDPVFDREHRAFLFSASVAIQVFATPLITYPQESAT